MAEVQMFNVGNDLIEAYQGYYEDELMVEFCEEYGGPDAPESEKVEWVRNEVIRRILCDTPKRRLEIYLEWNGIIGYSSRIYELAIGHF